MDLYYYHTQLLAKMSRICLLIHCVVITIPHGAGKGSKDL